MKLNEATAENLAKGDNDAWKEVLSQFGGVIDSALSWRKWSFAPHVKDDLAQQVKTDMIRATAGLAASSSPERFIKRICVRRCIDEVRRQIRERTRYVDVTSRADDEERHETDFPADKRWDPIRIIALTERARLLTGLIGELGETCRIAIHYFYVEEYSYQEIAGKLDISIQTVGARLSKCLARLRKKNRRK